MRHLRGKDFIADTESPSGTWLKNYIHPDDHNRVMAAIHEAIASKSPFELEHPVIRVDGTTGWTHSRAIPLLDAEGEILEWFGAARDITERKQAEETQQLLLGELNHRVKNILASVEAIVQHTLRTTNNPNDFAASFTGRIQAMSRVHSLLSSSAWKGADLRDVIRDQLLMGPVDESRLTAWGPPVHLEPQSAQHLALMLHELGTNSTKYGALSRADGYVTVSWTVADALLRLQWLERGGPPVSTPMRRGFGTKFIEQSARGEGGDARMLVDAQGLSWEITLPLRAQTASSTQSAAMVGTEAPLKPRAVSGKQGRLEGKRFLVVEDEPLVAMDLVAVLQRAGAETAGPVGSSALALALMEKEQLDGALLDANLRGRPVGDIAAALTRLGVPFVFVTGYGRASLPEAFAKSPMLSKPFTEAQILEAAAELTRPRGAVVRLRE